MGIMLVLPPNQTPPTPHFEASTNPWYVGGCSTSSLTLVGLLPTMRRSADQSRRILLRSVSTLISVLFERAAAAMYRSSCPRIGLPQGMAIDVNCSLPCSFWNRFRLTFLSFRISFSS